jgi:hypothetical protein
MSSNLMTPPTVSRYIPQTTTFSTSTYSCPLASAYSFPDSSFSTYAIGTTASGAASVLPKVPPQQVNSQTADSTNITAQTNSKIKGSKQLDSNTVFTNPLFTLTGFGSFLAGIIFGLFRGKTAHA